MSDAPENREAFAVPLDELEAQTLAHYEDAASALGEWVNTIPRAIREHFARRRADAVTPDVKAALERLDGLVGLHEGIEIIYVVDGYEAMLTEDDGAIAARSAFGETIVDALCALASMEEADDE